MTKKKLILVVEDEPDMADYIKSVLTRNDKYDILNAYNGLEALNILEKNSRFLGFARNKIDCIILDIKMPKMNGIQFLKAARKAEFYTKSIPIVLLSAYEDKEKWGEATDPSEGFVCSYLKKPFEKKELLTTVERIFNNEVNQMVKETIETALNKLPYLDEKGEEI